LAALGLFLAVQAAVADLPDAVLESSRVISTGDWLRVRLELLGLRLSYPAYRVDVELNQDRRVAFTFMASAGMAEHLYKLERDEAGKVLAYHAEGIGHQVEELLKADFPEAWSRFAAGEDLGGRFLVPGAQRESPPRELAAWTVAGLIWSP
jgi:hypothetical protein